MDDFYKILGVEENATPEKIKQAYRTLAKKYHPDHNKDDPNAEQKFKQISHAYDVLKNPQKKQQYDFEKSASQHGMHGFSHPFSNSTEDMEDILRHVFGHHQNRRYQGFHWRTGSYGFAQNRDEHLQIQIDLKESLQDTSKTIVHRSADGTQKTIDVNIPAGIKNGQTIRLRGQGNQRITNAAPSDLLITVHFKENNLYEVDDADLIHLSKIDVWTALSGGKLRAPTVEGQDVEIKIPSGVQNGTIFRLQNRGLLKSVSSKARGDMFVKVEIEIPKLHNHQIKELENLRKKWNS